MASTIALVSLIVAAASAVPTSEALRTLVEAERGFARASVERGMRAAFIDNLAADGFVFGPLPVNGRRMWKSRPASKATLTWEPAFAEVSAAGDLGYTTGPWELHPPAEHAVRPVLHGHFISVWRRARPGPWKVVVDLGSSHEKVEPGVGSGAFVAGPTHPATKVGPRPDFGAAQREIDAAEQRFSAEAERQGFAAAFAARATEDVRWNRDGAPPALGMVAARAAADPDTTRSRWTPTSSGASRSGDLGYAFGVRERLDAAGAPADSAAFLHVWRREGTMWRLALAVDNPIRR